MQLIEGAGKFTKPVGPFDTHWVEQFRVPDLSVGTYSIPAGGTDDQDPHTEDEIYVVTAGRAMFESGGKRVAVAAGSVIFVAAGEVHRFADVTVDLATIVLFAPAEGSRSVPHLVEFVTEHIAVFNAASASGDFSRLLARFTDDALMRFENVPGAGVLEFAGREAYTQAYATSPPTDQIDVAGDPREEEGAIVIDYLWRHAKTPGVMRLTLNEDDLISHMLVVFGYR
ncbi:MAG TPA: cupin domain-containing protein [Streptosporangiaceae bacterium]|nr:cupin domain-containing protein [Streptosporangiaceae bacterium]